MIAVSRLRPPSRAARLGDALRLRKDVVHPHDNPRGRAVFVGLEHIESGTGRRLGAVELEMAELAGRKPRFYAGDIVYGYLRPYLNKVWIAEFDGPCSVDQYVYAVSADIADPAYIAWFMRSPVYLARAPVQASPGQLPRIRTEEVASVPIELPSLEEQRRIAAILNHAEALRAKRRHALASINTLSNVIFTELFGDPAMNPKGWELRPVGDLTMKFSDGPFGSNLKS